MTRTELFYKWLDEERQKRHLSWLAMEKAGGLSNGAIVKRRDALDDPSARLCIGIAKALTLPVEEVLSRAGILPKSALDAVGSDAAFKELIAITRQLSDCEKDNSTQAGAEQLAQQRQNEQRQREQALTTIEQIDVALLRDDDEQRRAIVDAIDVRAQLRITASGRRYLIVSSLIAPQKRYAL